MRESIGAVTGLGRRWAGSAGLEMGGRASPDLASGEIHGAGPGPRGKGARADGEAGMRRAQAAIHSGRLEARSIPHDKVSYEEFRSDFHTRELQQDHLKKYWNCKTFEMPEDQNYLYGPIPTFLTLPLP